MCYNTLGIERGGYENMENIIKLINEKGLLKEEQINLIDALCRKIDFKNPNEMPNLVAISKPENKEIQNDFEYIIDYLLLGAPKTFAEVLTRDKLRKDNFKDDKVYFENDVQLQVEDVFDEVVYTFLENKTKEIFERDEVDVEDPFVVDMISDIKKDVQFKSRYIKMSQELDIMKLASKDKEAVLESIALILMNAKKNIPDEQLLNKIKRIDMWKLQAISLKYLQKLGPFFVNGDNSNINDADENLPN